MTLLHRSRSWLAAGLWLLTAVLATAGGLLVARSPEARGHDLLGVPDLLLSLPFLLGSATVGALVMARRPGNPVGWVLGTCGLLVALDGCARAYAIQGLFVRPGSLPAAPLVLPLDPVDGSGVRGTATIEVRPGAAPRTLLVLELEGLEPGQPYVARVHAGTRAAPSASFGVFGRPAGRHRRPCTPGDRHPHTVRLRSGDRPVARPARGRRPSD